MGIRSLLRNVFGRPQSTESVDKAESSESTPPSEAEPRPETTRESATEPKAEPAPAAATTPEPSPEPAPEPQPETAAEPEARPAPATRPESAPVSRTAPAAAGAETDDAATDPAEPEPAPEPQPETAAAPETEPATAPASRTAPVEAETEADDAATDLAEPEPTTAESGSKAEIVAGSGLAAVEAKAPELVGLYKAAAVSLEKHGLSGQRAAVYLVLDRSGSMRRYYKDGTVQHLAEQVLGLSANLDDDGIVPVVFFSTDIDGTADISLTHYAGRIGELHDTYGHMGRTSYHCAIEAVVEHYEKSGATDPALVIFQTDGAPTSKAAAERALCEAADKPLFWQFIGFGDPKSAGLNFLRKLDSGLPVPEKRTIDNAGFFHAGLEPRELTDADLYEGLTEEFPRWLAAAREAGIVR
ncbi:VWA domain-containing protein [Streptomyces gobiensis]|uniref:VWA domain-containing protein n=1 Tax=Streptomyces gobiensis TaxID=2875706 RepID=UPI001E37E970|nr:VWA domain-containing protein [Streptomyces gobiensis]UGY92663.1 VWA domain-containing protein [Streptomyces gobiensis]